MVIICKYLGQEVEKKWKSLVDHFCKIVNAEKSKSAGAKQNLKPTNGSFMIQ